MDKLAAYETILANHPLWTKEAAGATGLKGLADFALLVGLPLVATGAGVGAATDSENRMRGAVTGGAVGALGGTAGLLGGSRAPEVLRKHRVAFPEILDVPIMGMTGLGASALAGHLAAKKRRRSANG